MAFLCVAAFMVFLDVSIVNVALPSIEHGLHMSETNLQYVVTAYGTVLGGFLLLGGRVADVIGRRRALRLGLVVFALASLLAGLASTSIVLVTARGLQGLGSALIAPSALGLLMWTHPEGAERNRALGVWGGMTGLASVAGVVLGGLLADGPGWRWIFFINVPIGLAAAALAPRVLPENVVEQGRRDVDVVGALALTAGLVGLIYSLGQAPEAGWGSARTIGGLVGAGVLLAGFGLRERSSRVPLIPPGMLRLPVLPAANLATMPLFGALVTLFFFASLFLQQVLGYSPTRTGLAYIPLAVIVSVGAGLASGLVTKMAAKPVLLTGLVLTAGGLLLLSRAPADSRYLVDILPAFLVVGLGLGLSFVPLQVAASSGVPEAESGLAAGLINTSQEAGGALGVAVAATIAFSRIPALTRAAHGDPLLIRAARSTVFHHAFLVGAGFAAAALLLTLFLLPWLAAAIAPTDRRTGEGSPSGGHEAT